MTKLIFSVFVSGLFLAACATTAPDGSYPGYLTDADGALVRDKDGHCWRLAHWRPSMAVPECDLALAPVQDSAEAAEVEAAEAVALPAPAAFTQQAMVHFAFSADAVSASDVPALEQLLAALRTAVPDSLQIGIHGHSDRIGSQRENLALSERRAEQVRDWLRGQGVPAAVIHVHAHGEAQPRTSLADCPHRLPWEALIDCLAPDRRVRIVVRGQR